MLLHFWEVVGVEGTWILPVGGVGAGSPTRGGGVRSICEEKEGLSKGQCSLHAER